MINIASEKLITLEQAAEKLIVSKCSVMRWIRYGTKGVRLEAIKFGGHWRTSEEALQRFGDRMTPDSEPTRVPQSVKNAEFQRRAKAAGEALDVLLGIRKCTSCKTVVNVSGKTIPKKEKLLCPHCVVNEPKVTLGQILRTFRWNSSLSQSELSNRSGISVESIRVYEKNQKPPAEEHLGKLIEVFGDV